MKTFIYKLKDQSGKTLYGFTEAENKRELKHKFRYSQFYFISAEAARRKDIFKRKADLNQLLMFTHRFSSLIEAGIPILSAVMILWRQTDDQTLQLVISHMREKMEGGETLTRALKDFPRIFPLMYTALIGVAEKAGGLVHVLKKLTSYLEYQKNIISRTQKATLYPTIVIVFAVIVLLGMFTFVVPTFENVLSKLDIELPILTKAILWISQTLRSGYFILGVFIFVTAGIFIYKWLKRGEKFAYRVDDLKLRIPFFGDILYTVAISRFIHSLGILMGAGVPIIQSFDAAESTVANRKIENSIASVQKQIEHGESLYKSFDEQKDFPIILTEMVGVGETSGTIVDIFERLATHFDQEVDYRLNRFLTFLEPFLIIFVGGIVILILLSVYMPIFSLWQGLAQ
jgi:type IV pilus assembly protein PilC